MAVHVTRHAFQRAVHRRHYDCPPGAAGQRIAADVQDAIAAGRESRFKPTWTQLVSLTEQRGRKLRPLRLNDDERFVWNADETLGWIIKREDGRVVVVTAMHRVRNVDRVAA